MTYCQLDPQGENACLPSGGHFLGLNVLLNMSSPQGLTTETF